MSELSRETERLLLRGRGGVPLRDVHRARLKRTLLAQAAASSVTLGASSAAAWTALASKALTLVGLVGALGAAGAVGVRAWQGAHPRHEHETGSRAEPNLGVAPRANTSVLLPPEPLPTPSLLAPSKTATQEGLARAARPAKRIAPAGEVAPDPMPPEAPRSGALDAPGAMPAEAVAPPDLPTVSALEEEASLLRKANAALNRGDALRALATLHDLDTRFPSGSLMPERAAERVFALCTAGRVQEARAEAATFLATHAVGPLAARVRSSCGSTGE